MNLSASKIFVDSSVWLELLDGSDKGEKARDFLVPRDVLTSSISVAEVERVLLKKGRIGKLNFIRSIMDSCSVDVDVEIARKAAKISIEKKLGMADAIIAASSIIEKATLYTCDYDFKNKDLDAIILD
jgi:predicted nucleic acid-binding protein